MTHHNEDKESFKQRIQERLSEVDRDLDRWRSRENDPDVQAARTKRTDLGDQLRRADDVAEANWEEFKRDADRAWEGLKSDIHRLTSR